jgi:hypothetical protein
MEIGIVGENDTGLSFEGRQDACLVVGDRRFLDLPEPKGCDVFDARQLFADRLAQRCRDAAGDDGISLINAVGHYPVYAIAAGLEPIETKLKMNDEVYDKRGTKPDRKAKDVDQREKAVPTEIPNGDKEIIFKHVRVGLMPGCGRHYAKLINC